jgi:hypothetical protein
VFPHIFNQWRGEALSREKREIRDEVSFQASEELRKKPRGLDEPESLPNRICRTLDGVRRNGKWEGGTSKCAHELQLVR